MKFFMHGVPDTAQMWRPLIAELGLAEDAFHAPNLPGFGCPLPDHMLPTMDGYAAWLTAELERVAEKSSGKIDLVGHDWGALLSLRVAALRPDLINSVAVGGAVIDGAYRGHRNALIWNTPVLGEIFMRLMTARVLAPALEREGVPAALAQTEAAALDRTMKRCILKLYRSADGLRGLGRWEDGLSGLPGRPLIVWGENDPYVPLNHAEIFAAKWDCRLHVEKGKSHWAIATETAAVARLLRAHWG